MAAAAALGGASLEGAGCRELDASVRGLSRALARHELELSRRILGLHRADGWRRLGYASEAQYARERLGMSRSSMVARRALALRLEKLPRVAEALGVGKIGVEAALVAVRVSGEADCRGEPEMPPVAAASVRVLRLELVGAWFSCPARASS